MGTQDTSSAEERRLRLDEMKLDLERQRLELDRSFAKKWAPTLSSAAIPLLIACGTVVISYGQFTLAQRDSGLKGIDYYVKVFTDASYRDLAAEDHEVVLAVLAEFFPEIWRLKAVHTAVVGQIVSGPGASGDPNEDTRYRALSRLPQVPAGAGAPAEAAQRSGAARYTVYVHYRNSADLGVVQRLAEQLKAAGYIVPGLQRVTQATNGDIRYYHQGERGDAEQLKGLVEKAIGKDAPKLELIDISRTFPNLPSGIMEIWIPDMKPP